MSEMDTDAPEKMETAETGKMEIPAPELAGLIIHVRATSPMIMHRFGKKAADMMREKQAKKATKSAKGVRGPKQIAAEIKDCFHVVANTDGATATTGLYGIPSISFKTSAVNAARFGTGLPMTKTRSIFFVVGEIVPIRCEMIEPREDAVRLPTGVADLRYRPYFHGWEADVPIEYFTQEITKEQLVNLFDIAGRQVGIGDNRPQRKGDQYGRFEVVSVKEVPLDELPSHQKVPESNETLDKAMGFLRKAGTI